MIENSHLIKRAAVASICVAVVLLIAKIFAWWVSGSTSVLASLMDSFMDIAASLVNFFAIRYALTPPDEDHPFGHTKAEGLAALMQSGFILGSGLILILQVAERLMNPDELTAIPESLGVMGFSTLMTVLLVMYQRWVWKKTGSLAVKSDSAHYVSDILTNIAVVVALVAAYMGFYWLDPVVGLLIAVILVYSAFGILREALTMLMDSAMGEEDELQLKQLIEQTPDVFGYHDLKTRQSGVMQFIQFHLELEAGQSLQQAHDIGDELEKRIVKAFPQSHVIVHYDPV